MYIFIFFFRCGPGVWTLEMAGAYKNSSFTGIDIVANFPQTVSKESI
jgi:hypothetical protein